ncbi:PaiB family negative transcriptional regulator [Scopulibacillus darangshiensis]|uniref:PaiB family negative transcriptional regulator n=1 Tax=Scopulibacillus darangshiensis TaxID=442528 RepID=A0A4R2P5L1_9BACL|nr:FMN-binding negative transcriptional regulator [Scopulibacillus darangshiensis]TCP29404.1 PaiB family negative transcriptional regulator [Scopulibacillus darangshiensis]
MYIPKHFMIKDEEEAYNIIKEHSFATLFSQHNGEPFATHLPLILNREEGLLYGHFARPNPQWRDIEDQNVLAVFHGPHAYISSSWYETTKSVPTWSYVAVHVTGRVKIVENEEELIGYLHDLVQAYEEPDSSYNLEEIDPSFISGMSKGIVGFKINIDKMEGKYKLSQNHSSERRKRVIDQLEQIPGEDAKQIAKLMKENLGNKKVK